MKDSELKSLENIMDMKINLHLMSDAHKTDFLKLYREVTNNNFDDGEFCIIHELRKINTNVIVVMILNAILILIGVAILCVLLEI